MLRAMIEQTTLLRLAHDYADRKMKERPTMRAVVLVGSVARGEPPLGDAVDLDILLIDDFIPDPPFDLVRLSDNVLVDAVFVRSSDYADRKALRTQPFSAPALNDALILHDPRHYFDILQASVRAPYNKPDNLYGRARAAFEAARSSIDRFSLWREDPPAAPPGLDDLTEFRQALYHLGQSLILLTGSPGDTVGWRKFMVRYEAASRQQAPGLYPLFLDALGAARFPAADFELFLADWLTLYKSSPAGRTDPLVHPARRGYYERGFRALVAEGHTLNSLWLFEHTLAACARGLDPQPEALRRYWRVTGKDSSAGFSDRIGAAEQLLAQTDTALIAWARSENVQI
jgi:hypothetical protein